MTTRGAIIDLDGTVWVDDAPSPGAAEAIAALRAAGVPLRFATNTPRKPRARLATAGRLSGHG